MRKPLFCLMIAVLVCLAAVPSALAYSWSRTVITPTLNLYAEPDPTSAIVATLSRNEHVNGSGMDRTNGYITITTETGITGWANFACMQFDIEHLVICEEMPLYASPQRYHITDFLSAGMDVVCLEEYESASGEVFYLLYLEDGRTGFIPKYANVYNPALLDSYKSGRSKSLLITNDTNVYTHCDKNSHVITRVKADEILPYVDMGAVTWDESLFYIVLIGDRYGYIPKNNAIEAD